VQNSKIQRAREQNARPDQVTMQQLLTSLQSHPQAWAFLQPVNGEEVTDYYDVIKKPMGMAVLYVNCKA
jgi:histone acetyltransferase